MGCNGRTFEELPPDWNCRVRVGCNGLQCEDFSGITPWLKLPCKSALQCVKWCNSERVICSEGVKRCKSWAAKGVKRWKSEGGNLMRGRKWCKSEGVICWEGAILTSIFHIYRPSRVRRPLKVWRLGRRSWAYWGCAFKTGSLQVWGLKQCKIEGVKWCKSWAAKGGKMM